MSSEPRPLERIDLSADDPTRHRYHELAESLRHVGLALRQLHRAQDAHRREQTRRHELGFTSGDVPDELIALGQERDDAMDFAIVAAARAVKAHWHLTTKRSLSLPAFRQQDTIRALRDLGEHWNLWRLAEPPENFVDDARWLLLKDAGRRWAQASGGGRPIGSFGFTGGSPATDDFDPDTRVTTWNHIDIDHLTDDLETLRGALTAHRDQAFEWEYLDQAAARELLGPTVWNLLHWFTTVRGRRMIDGVVRWERALLLAADRTIREQRWLVDGRVLGPRDEESAL